LGQSKKGEEKKYLTVALSDINIPCKHFTVVHNNKKVKYEKENTDTYLTILNMREKRAQKIS
jgi:hypothetical protein